MKATCEGVSITLASIRDPVVGVPVVHILLEGVGCRNIGATWARRAIGIHQRQSKGGIE